MISHCILLSTIGYLFTSFSAQGDWKIYALQLPKLLDKLASEFNMPHISGRCNRKKMWNEVSLPWGSLEGRWSRKLVVPVVFHFFCYWAFVFGPGSTFCRYCWAGQLVTLPILTNNWKEARKGDKILVSFDVAVQWHHWDGLPHVCWIPFEVPSVWCRLDRLLVNK